MINMISEFKYNADESQNSRTLFFYISEASPQSITKLGYNIEELGGSIFILTSSILTNYSIQNRITNMNYIIGQKTATSDVVVTRKSNAD